MFYLAVVVWFRRELVEWLYNGRYHSAAADLVWPLAVFGLLTAAIGMMIAALRAFGSAMHIFRAYLFSALASLALAPAWIQVGGVQGAAYGFAAAWIGVTVAMLVSLRIASRHAIEWTAVQACVPTTE
jgi:O-antigen/teichoic acid export membrane protein